MAVRDGGLSFPFLYIVYHSTNNSTCVIVYIVLFRVEKVEDFYHFPAVTYPTIEPVKYDKDTKRAGLIALKVSSDFVEIHPAHAAVQR